MYDWKCSTKMRRCLLVVPRAFIQPSPYFVLEPTVPTLILFELVRGHTFVFCAFSAHKFEQRELRGTTKKARLLAESTIHTYLSFVKPFARPLPAISHSLTQ
jgi:hypothetical protein